MIIKNFLVTFFVCLFKYPIHKEKWPTIGMELKLDKTTKPYSFSLLGSSNDHSKLLLNFGHISILKIIFFIFKC